MDVRCRRHGIIINPENGPIWVPGVTCDKTGPGSIRVTDLSVPGVVEEKQAPTVSIIGDSQGYGYLPYKNIDFFSGELGEEYSIRWAFFHEILRHFL